MVWRRAWREAPRRLRTTREGKIIIAVAFATGFAAINTGNNPGEKTVAAPAWI